MKPISHDEFSIKIQAADLICSPEYGYFAKGDRPNPYRKQPFVVPNGFQAYASSFEEGELIALARNNQWVLMAFLV